MSAERLTKIKEIQDYATLVYQNGDPKMELHDVVIKLWEQEHTDWLIEQAEKLQAISKAFDSIEFEESESTTDDFYDDVKKILNK